MHHKKITSHFLLSEQALVCHHRSSPIETTWQIGKHQCPSRWAQRASFCPCIYCRARRTRQWQLNGDGTVSLWPPWSRSAAHTVPVKRWNLILRIVLEIQKSIQLFYLYFYNILIINFITKCPLLHRILRVNFCAASGFKNTFLISSG